MGEDDPDRVEGVDFSSVNPVLDDLWYPIMADDWSNGTAIANSSVPTPTRYRSRSSSST